MSDLTKDLLWVWFSISFSAILFILHILTMIYGWGLTPKSYPIICGTFIFAIIIRSVESVVKGKK